MFRLNKNTVQLLIKTQMWGPLLVGVGIICLFATTQAEGSLIIGSRVSISAVLVIVGLSIMLIQVWPRKLLSLDENVDETSIEGLGRLVRQLAHNYNLLRRQTTQGFLITLILMTLGVVVILTGVFGALFGLTSQTMVISGIAGTVTELIAGSTLVVYRLNFKRLNEVTDHLEESWRVLSAYSLVSSLPLEKQTDATLSLINALVRTQADIPGKEIP